MQFPQNPGRPILPLHFRDAADHGQRKRVIYLRVISLCLIVNSRLLVRDIDIGTPEKEPIFFLSDSQDIL